MELAIAITERKSSRAFTLQVIPREAIEKIIRLAVCAPSGLNLQPWDICVVTGEEKDRLSRVLLKAYKEKQVSCSPKTKEPLPVKYSSRSGDLPKYLEPFLKKTGSNFQQFINEGSCNFYGAPAALIFCLDKIFSKDRLIDIGILIGYLLLSAKSFGLGTCPIGLVAEYQDEVKELLNIAGNKDVVLGIALGYEDEGSPVNAYKSHRDELGSFVTWIAQE